MEQFGLTVREDDVAGAVLDGQEATDRFLKLFTEDSRFADEVLKHIRSATYRAAGSRS